MGLNLRSILHPAEVSLADLRGETVAVDAYGLFYQFLTMLRDNAGRVLTDDHGNPISHLIGLVSKTEELLAADVLPVYVFDGKPHPLKLRTLAARAALKKAAGVRLETALRAGDLAAIRREAAQTTTITPHMVDMARALLDAAGLPYVMAPQDAEAQCAAMAANGVVDAAVSQDYDTVVYGAPRVLRNLMSTSRTTEEVLLAAVQMETRLDRDGLVDLALLVGNDFSAGVPGVGPKTGLKLVAQYAGLGRFLERCAKGYAPGSAVERRVAAAAADLTSPDAEEVRSLFLRPRVELDVRVRAGEPDASLLHDRMHAVHGFSRGRSDRFATQILDLVERRESTVQTRLAA